ncbi:hypothetical protein Zmor_022511 [Zophobas morio]|uniref:Uncharacterized protein n=1 Tax=Zophobas morio TaxID=2755281 RepID=A0AA38HVS4_9CUCU|nr:hypothetical protein Zmor_022511 [Zophobas morio]
MPSLQVLVIIVALYKQVLACGPYSFDYKIFEQLRVVQNFYNVEEISECHENQSVFVEDNDIPELCCKILACRNPLDGITFNSCFIRKLEENCFSDSLQNVSFFIAITGNKITIIKKHTFRDLVVTEINLNDNSIEELEDEAFLHLDNLRSINLNNNLLKAINSKAFTLVPRLERLHLFENRITTLQAGVFSFLATESAQIYLMCNEIFQIERSAFDNLSSRVTLDLNLNGNRIETLEEDIFNNHSVRLFDVSFNPLKKISRNFCGQECAMQDFEFTCAYLALEDVEFVLDWAKAKGVNLIGGGCSHYNLTFMLRPTQFCDGAKNFGHEFSWQLYVCVYLILVNCN